MIVKIYYENLPCFFDTRNHEWVLICSIKSVGKIRYLLSIHDS